MRGTGFSPTREGKVYSRLPHRVVLRIKRGNTCEVPDTKQGSINVMVSAIINTLN